MARRCDSSAAACGSTPAFRQDAKKAAPAPKNVQRAAPAKRHKVLQSAAPALPAGLPSKMQMVLPPSSAPSCTFHMIQPVLEYQWKRSPPVALGPTLLCKVLSFSASSMTPPWPCTIGLGSPVVPLEYTTHSGWSKGSQSICSGTSSASRRLKSCDWRVLLAKAATSQAASRFAHSTACCTEGNSASS